MRQLFACFFAALLYAAPAAAQSGYLAGGPEGDRPEYRGGGGHGGRAVVEIWDGEQWRPYAYCQTNPCGTYNAHLYRDGDDHRADVHTYAQVGTGQYTYADCPAGTEPSIGDDGERICLRRSGRVTTRDDLPRHTPRYDDRPEYHPGYGRDDRTYRRHDERHYTYSGTYSAGGGYRYDDHHAPPARPCEYRREERRQGWDDCYRSREWTDYRRFSYRGDIDLRVYPREWYGQDGRYWREVRGGGYSGCACTGYSRERHYSECGHYDHTTHYGDRGYGYYDDGLAWSYFGVRSPVYYGGGGGSGFRNELVLPSAGARARAIAGAGAGAGASANVNVNTRVNTGVHVRIGGGGRWRGGHGGGCRSGCGHGGGHY